ncbi:hypothetical protein LCGC14_1191740 [marine sediment metagenome]|uniref:Uncharacterized protein n=1 Tax=marine sediment metagenome TaxID=412755 RepID=A0A0F9LNX4_9ZZZZ
MNRKERRLKEIDKRISELNTGGYEPKEFKAMLKEMKKLGEERRRLEKNSDK